MTTTENVAVKTMNFSIREFKGVYYLNVAKISYENEVISSRKIRLVEVTTKKLAEYRKSRNPFLVLKVNGRLYCTKISDELSSEMENARIFGKHKCACNGKTCERLSSASDEEGGCAKVRNYGERIENYPFITIGYETFNTNYDALIVIECLKYKNETVLFEKKFS